MRSSVNAAHNAAGRERLLPLASASRAVRSGTGAPQKKECRMVLTMAWRVAEAKMLELFS